VKNAWARSLFSIGLICVALVPWAETIVSLVSQSLSGAAPSPPYESIDAIRDIGLTWQVYWHIVVFVAFCATLYMNETIGTRDKVVWTLGLFFLWPIASVVFVVKHVWLRKRALGTG